MPIDPQLVATAVELAPKGAVITSAAYMMARLGGPSVDAAAEVMGAFTRERLARILRIGQAAEKMIEHVPHDARVRVDERVWDRVFVAADSDDEWVIAYLAGALASARTTADQPVDMGARIAALVSAMTVHQLKAHHLFYSLMREQLLGEPVDNLLDRTESAGRSVFIPFTTASRGLGLSWPESESIISHCIYGLRQDHLIGLTNMGSADKLKRGGYIVDEPGMVVFPYNVGIDLYMWAHGAGSQGAQGFFDDRLGLFLHPEDETRPLPSGAVRIRKVRPTTPAPVDTQAT